MKTKLISAACRIALAAALMTACGGREAREGLLAIEGGATGAAIGADGTVFAASGAGLDVIDARDAAAPRKIGGAALGHAALDVAVSGALAAVVTAKPSLELFDISDPAAPIARGSMALEGRPTVVALGGGLAVVMDVDSGFQAIDLADAGAPRAGGRYEVEGNAFGIAVVEKTACLAVFESGLHIVDLGDLAKPREVGVVKEASAAWDVALAGDGILSLANHQGGALLLDLREAMSGKGETLGALDLPGSSVKVAATAGRAFIATKKRAVHEIDIRDPSRPSIALTIEGWGGVADLAADGDLLAAATPQGVRVRRARP